MGFSSSRVVLMLYEAMRTNLVRLGRDSEPSQVRSCIAGYVAGVLILSMPVVAADPGIQRVRVESTSLTSIGYDSRARALVIEFRSGSTYRYREVPHRVFLELVRSDSKGRYFSKKIRGKYPHERLVPRMP